MALVPHKITALAESDAQGTDGKNIVAGAVVSLYDTDGAAVTLFDDENGGNGSTAKQTDATGQVVVYVEQGEYDEEVNGSTRRRLLVGSKSNDIISYGTTAEIEALRPNQTGSRIENRERANAQYVLREEGYVAQAGDLTAANGRVWELQLNKIIPEYFGAVGDGVTDDTSVLIEAISVAGSRGVELTASGRYRTTEKLTFSGTGLTVKFVGNAVILPDASVLVAVQIGSETLPSRMKLKGLRVDRGSYNGATENIGFEYKECNQSTFEDFESRFSKYNHRFSPAVAGMAYNTLINMQAVGGFYNFHGFPSGTGFFNENVFLGGRGFVTSDTDTNLQLERNGLGDSNHNRFLSMSLEGNARAIYCDTGSNYFEFPRTEGATIDLELGANSEYNFVLSTRFDLTITDNGFRNSYITYGSGAKFVTAINNTETFNATRLGANTLGVPATSVNDLFNSSGNSYINEWRHGRDNSTSYVFKSIRDSDDLVRSSLTTSGILQVAQSLRSEQSSWNFQPLKLGNYALWVDSSGRLRIKNGTPTSETDGTIVGTQS